MKRKSDLYEWALLIGLLTIAILIGCVTNCDAETVVVCSPGCVPCQRMKNYIWQVPEIVSTTDDYRAYGVTRTPTTIVTRDGREIYRHVGYLNKQQLSAVAQLEFKRPAGYWVARPVPIASVCLFGGGVSVGTWQWVWVGDGT